MYGGVTSGDVPPSVFDGVMCHNESNRATTVVCCGGAVAFVVMFDIIAVR